MVRRMSEFASCFAPLYPKSQGPIIGCRLAARHAARIKVPLLGLEKVFHAVQELFRTNPKE